jgi:RHS repeat-associated protein
MAVRNSLGYHHAGKILSRCYVVTRAGPSPCADKFTGNERDTESNLDYFGARYDASSMGRFMSPDPSSALVLRVIGRQRWNGYS